MKKKYKYIQLVSKDQGICDEISNILVGKRNKKSLLLKYIELGLGEAMKQGVREKKGSRYICSIPLRYDHPEESKIIALKEKFGYQSSEIFINAILIGFKKTNPLEAKI